MLTKTEDKKADKHWLGHLVNSPIQQCTAYWSLLDSSLTREYQLGIFREFEIYSFFRLTGFV
jgi:hypothetical protein